ncbi:IS30-like element ISMsm8 family transposase [Nesterenkonia lacusekhoensis]
MNPRLAPTVSGRYISSSEREDIALWRAQDTGVREIARRLGRSPSTISRELRRNASTRTYQLQYKASTAQWHAERRARRPKTAKVATNDRLRQYVQDKLSGAILTAAGEIVGPDGPAWDGKNKPHRGDRHKQSWHLRRGRTKRMPRARTRQEGWAHVTAETVLQKRPKEVEDRKIAGHWEGDLIIGLKRSAVATLIERTTRYTMLVHLPRQVGYGLIPPKKNGPALAGYGALTMKDALINVMTPVPPRLRRSLTWDRGKELPAHALFTEATKTPVYFADAKSPWQRGSNEHLNGLLRQYFPKGTDLSRWSAAEIAAIATTMNNRPRGILGWRTPAEAFEDQLRSAQQSTVATTG